MKKTILIIVTMLCAVGANATAATRTVGPGRTYADIQTAINACGSGDTVLVYDGTYTGGLNWDLDFLGKRITVRSVNGPESCTIVGGLGHRLFYFHGIENNNSVVEGFTITDGYVNDNGGAILCEGSASPTIRDCIFRDNEATGLAGAGTGYGGAIACMDSSSPRITGCTIEDNMAAYGGGIGAYTGPGKQPGTLIISDCPKIGNNEAGWGGGIYCDSQGFSQSTLTITNSVITGNSASSINYHSADPDAYGGGVYASNCEVAISDSTINSNSAYSQFIDSFGGGIYCSVSSLELVKSTVNDNFAEIGASGGWSYGGGICHVFQGGMTLTIDNSSLIGNRAQFGGGAYLFPDGPVLLPKISNSIICSNQADTTGGGLYFNYMVDGTITNCVISGNTAIGFGGGIELTQSAPAIANCIMAGNASIGQRAGAVDCYGSSPTIANCTFAGNSATVVGGVGGGISCEADDLFPPAVPANPTIVNCIFAGNDNHAIYEYGLDADPRVTYCHFYDNNPLVYGDYFDSSLPEPNGMTYTGAAQINSISDGFAGNNIDGDPAFVMDDPNEIIMGVWTTEPSYNPITNRTTLTHWGASFVPGALVNMHINPDTNQMRQAIITANTASTIEVPGDITMPAGYVENGDPYRIMDYRLRIHSVCIDAGDSTAVPADAADLDSDGNKTEQIPLDFDGVKRFVEDPWHDNVGNGPGAIVDIGPYEIQVPTTIVVDKSATGDNIGRTWQDALNNLQDAIDIAIASAGGIDQIHVAQGTYRPDEGAAETPGDQNATFQLHTGLAIRGGYVGVVSTEPNSRHIRAYPTILSGDLADDDDTAGNSENSYHVVTGSGTDSAAILEGFTIKAGNANGGGGSTPEGGGMYNDSGSPTVASCMFFGNSASGGGGAVANQSGSAPTMVSCAFLGNQAIIGGGVTNFGTSSPSFINCTFSANTALSSAGGIFNDPVSSPELINCILWNNTDNGAMPGAAQIYSGSPVVSYSCIQDADPNGAVVYPGIGNFDGPPLFVDANGVDDVFGTEDDDLRLASASGCADVGDNSAVSGEFGDCFGHARIIHDIVDMGAFERLFPLDYDGSGKMDGRDVLFFADHWLETGCSGSGAGPGDWCFDADLTRNGSVDYFDFAEMSRLWRIE